MRKTLPYFVLQFFLINCNQSNPYTYIEAVKLVNEKGDSIIKYRAGEHIFQDSDSAAYVEAYRKFVISKTVNANLSNSKGPMPFRPFDFILWNPEGIDISKTLQFTGKKSFEKRMEENIGALEIELH